MPLSSLRIDHDQFLQQLNDLATQGQNLRTVGIGPQPAAAREMRRQYLQWDRELQQVLRSAFASPEIAQDFQTRIGELALTDQLPAMELPPTLDADIVDKLARLERLHEDLTQPPLSTGRTTSAGRPPAAATSSAATTDGRATDPNTARRAFLLMPFTPELDWLREEITAGGYEAGVLVERADNIFRAGVIIDQVEEYIRAADVVIAVCTGKNANVFYELGIARAHHEAILIAEGNDDLPFDVRHYRAQLYGGTSQEDSRATLRRRVREAIQQTIAARATRGGASAPPTVGIHVEARRTAYRNWLQFTENLGTWAFVPGANPALFVQRLHDAKAELDLVASRPVLDAVQHYIDSLEVGLAAIQAATQGVTNRQDQIHRAGVAFGRAMEEPDRRVREAMRNDIGVDS